MKWWFGSVAIVAALGALPAVAGEHKPSGEWQGVILQEGQRASLFVSESQGGKWSGVVRFGLRTVPLDNLRVNSKSVHFEVPGLGAFDGEVGSDWMAGAETGGVPPASFALTRTPETEDPDADYVRNPPG